MFMFAPCWKIHQGSRSSSNASEEGSLSVLIALTDFLTTVDIGTPHEGQARHLEMERLSFWDLWWIPFPPASQMTIYVLPNVLKMYVQLFSRAIFGRCSAIDEFYILFCFYPTMALFCLFCSSSSMSTIHLPLLFLLIGAQNLQNNIYHLIELICCI
jgi:hypothetical protein